MGLSRHPLGQQAGDTRLGAEHQEDAHWHRLQHQGYTIVPDVLGLPLLQELRDYFDEVEARLVQGEQVDHCFRSEHGDVQINHLPLHRPSFQQLLAPPAVFPLVRRAMHAKYGEEPVFLDMADGFVCNDDHGQTWHADGEYVRLTFAIDDIDPELGGGTGFMPGTHRAGPLAGPSVQLQPWANMVGASGVPVGVDLEGATQMHGKAGCCAVNYTTLWHRRVPNRSAQALLDPSLAQQLPDVDRPTFS